MSIAILNPDAIAAQNLAATKTVAATVELDNIGQALAIFDAMEANGETTVTVNVELPGYSVPGKSDEEPPHSFAGCRCVSTVTLAQAREVIQGRQVELQTALAPL